MSAEGPSPRLEGLQNPDRSKLAIMYVNKQEVLELKDAFEAGIAALTEDTEPLPDPKNRTEEQRVLAALEELNHLRIAVSPTMADKRGWEALLDTFGDITSSKERAEVIAGFHSPSTFPRVRELLSAAYKTEDTHQNYSSI